MNSYLLDGYADGETMDEELSEILEKALMYATPLPLSPSEENMTTESPDVTPYSDSRLQYGNSLNLEQLCNESMDIFTQNENTNDVPNNSTKTIHNGHSSNTPNFSVTESSKEIHYDDFHDHQRNTVPHQNVESLDNISNEAFETGDRELSNIEIHMTSSSMDSNLEVLEPQLSLMNIHPDSTSGGINDLNDMADACLRFENDSKLTADSTTTVCAGNDGVRQKIKRRRRREKNPDPPPPTVLPPCDICNDKSSGYHYGANTCEACKGFYRRTLKKKEVDYKCKCTPDEKESWKLGPFKNGCPACRYEKCLAVGMSKNAIKIGRYTLNHKTRNIRKIKSIGSIDSLITSMTKKDSETSPVYNQGIDDVSPSCSVTSEVSEHSYLSTSTSDDSCPAKTTLNMSSMTTVRQPAMSLKEIDYIVKTLTKAHTTLIIDKRLNMNPETIKRNQAEYLEKYHLKAEVFGFLKNVSQDEFKDFYNATGMDIDGRLERLYSALKFFEEQISLVVAFAKEIPGFKQLSLDDQANLIKASRSETVLLCTHKSTIQNIDFEKRVVTSPWGVPLHFDELRNFISEEHHILRYRFSKQLSELNLSVQEESVLRTILILFTDRCKLDNPGQIDSLQEKMVTCLQHLFNIRPGGSGTLLYKIFNIITGIRELTDKDIEFVKSLLIKWPMINVNKYHLVREFLC